MEGMNPDSLENALNKAKEQPQNGGGLLGQTTTNQQPQQNTQQTNNQPQISKEEEIGYHKGAINTLLAERQELTKMVQNVETILQAHIKRLQELGINLQQQ